MWTGDVERSKRGPKHSTMCQEAYYPDPTVTVATHRRVSGCHGLPARCMEKKVASVENIHSRGSSTNSSPRNTTRRKCVALVNGLCYPCDSNEVTELVYGCVCSVDLGCSNLCEPCHFTCVIEVDVRSTVVREGLITLARDANKKYPVRTVRRILSSTWQLVKWRVSIGN